MNLIERVKEINNLLGNKRMSLANYYDPEELLTMSDDEAKRLKAEIKSLEKEKRELYHNIVINLKETYKDIIEKIDIDDNISDLKKYWIYIFYIDKPGALDSNLQTIINKFLIDASDMDRFKYRINFLMNLNDDALYDERIMKLYTRKNDSNFEKIIKNETLMSNSKFKDYMIKRFEGDLKYSFVSFNTDLMVDALKAGLDINLVLYVGNKELLENYFDDPYRNDDDNKELLESIIKSGSDNLIHAFLTPIFKLKYDICNDILLKFLKIDEIRNEIFNVDSPYFDYLILPLIEEKNLTPTSILDSYASLDSILELYKETFNDFEFHDMMHLFDKGFKNYIYYYDNNEIKKVPVLAYQKTMKDKIDRFIEYYVNYYDGNDEESEKLENEYSDVKDGEFMCMARESIELNCDKTLPQDEEDYWNYILSCVDYYEEENNEEVTRQLTTN